MTSTQLKWIPSERTGDFSTFKKWVAASSSLHHKLELTLWHQKHVISNRSQVVALNGARLCMIESSTQRVWSYDMDDKDPIPVRMTDWCMGAWRFTTGLECGSGAPMKRDGWLANWAAPCCMPLQMIGVYKLCHCLKVTKAQSEGPFGGWIYRERTTMVQ